MSITITTKIDIINRKVPPVINLSQYDSDFTLVFLLYASTGVFVVDDSTTAVIRGTKTSGNGYSASGVLSTISIAGISYTSVTITGDAQLTASAGKNIFEITLSKNGKDLSSANFIVNVERAPLDADTITDETVLMNLDSIIQSAESARQSAESARQSAESIDFGLDLVPTQGSTNAVSSGGLYEALHNTDTTLSQSGQAADAYETGKLKDDNPDLVFVSNTISRSMYGVTISFDNDGCITFDGTATGKLRYTIRGAVTTSDISLHAGKYIFSREMISGTASKNPFFAINDAGVTLNTEITLAEDAAVYIQINSGYTFSNAKYRFSVRKAGFTANDATARSLVKKKSIKILGIGNSYTRDSLRWLSGILIKSGYDNVIVGHGYIGSITLAEQYASLDSSNSKHSAYTYYKYINNEHQYTKDGKTLAEVITSELWDVVIFQQQSDEAGQYSSFVSSNFDINDFVSYVKTAIGNDNLKIGIALTWSHAQGYTGEKFVQYYGGDPTVQFSAIKETIPMVANHMSQCDFVVDVGDAVEYGRDNTYLSTLGDELLRTDKNHLYYGIPSYMAGLVYAMTICGINGTESKWYPTAEDEGVSGVVTSANYARIARQCAKKATMEVI